MFLLVFSIHLRLQLVPHVLIIIDMEVCKFILMWQSKENSTSISSVAFFVKVWIAGHFHFPLPRCNETKYTSYMSIKSQFPYINSGTCGKDIATCGLFIKSMSCINNVTLTMPSVYFCLNVPVTCHLYHH